MLLLKQPRRLLDLRCIVVVLVSLFVGASAQSASFRGLGSLPGGTFFSQAKGVSADGSFVVGKSASVSGTEAFLWDAVNGMQGLGDLPGSTFESAAFDVSDDGSVVVGWGKSTSSASGFEAFQWDTSNGLQGLGDLSGGIFFSGALGVSADGTTIAGASASSSGILEAFT